MNQGDDVKIVNEHILCGVSFSHQTLKEDVGVDLLDLRLQTGKEVHYLLSFRQ